MLSGLIPDYSIIKAEIEMFVSIATSIDETFYSYATCGITYSDKYTTLWSSDYGDMYVMDVIMI